MTARSKKTIAKAAAAEADRLLSGIKRVYEAPESADLVLRSQCLMVACQMASDGDDADSVIRAAEQYRDWIKGGKVPRKADIRAVT